MATNNNHKASYKMNKNQTAYIICRIVADHLGIDPSMVTPDSKLEEDLAANVKEIMDIIHSIATITNVSFDEDAEELALSVTYVDDLIEKALGESFFGKSLIDDEEDEDEEDEDEEDDVDVEAEQERFESFFESYSNGEYAKYDIYKLTNMFLKEAENCKDEGVAAKYLCVSAVVRMQYFCREWIDFDFENYNDEECSMALAEFCIVDALEAMEKCLEIETNNTEYNLVHSILFLMNDYWVERKPLSEVIIYDEVDDLYGSGTSTEDDIFDREDLVNWYHTVYDRLAEMFSCQLKLEKEYLDCYNELLEDYGEIGSRERKRLERDRKRLGIAEDRVQELEAKASNTSLTKDEQQYQNEYREMMVDYGGELGPIEKKRLKRFRFRLGIKTIRAFELELL